MKRMGVRSVLITNAAGGIRAGFRAGDLMILRDHINLMGSSPLIGPHDPFWGERFPDQTAIYTRAGVERLRRAAAAAGVSVQEGVYLAVTGPTYETPAEVRAFEHLGADAVGMSTAPEAILAGASGLAVAGLSCIGNLAAGIAPAPLAHDEIVAAALEVVPRMRALIAEYWKALGTETPAPPND